MGGVKLLAAAASVALGAVACSGGSDGNGNDAGGAPRPPHWFTVPAPSSHHPSPNGRALSFHPVRFAPG